MPSPGQLDRNARRCRGRMPVLGLAAALCIPAVAGSAHAFAGAPPAEDGAAAHAGRVLAGERERSGHFVHPEDVPGQVPDLPAVFSRPDAGAGAGEADRPPSPEAVIEILRSR